MSDGLRPALDPEERALLATTKPFQKASASRAVFELAISALGFAALWAATYFAFVRHPALAVVPGVACAMFRVRLFVLGHDCGHGSLFPSRRANEVVGHLLGVVTYAPFERWRRNHARHHATSGHLEHRGAGYFPILTTEEFRRASGPKRLLYRMYRSPVFLFGLAPLAVFLLVYRLPLGDARSRASVWWTNAGLVAVMGPLAGHLGLWPVLAVEVFTMAVAGAVGMWLFYVQHHFEGGYHATEGKWRFVSAALHGSSYYRLPSWLHWWTAGIGYHHLHHLNPAVPSYRLAECERRLGLAQIAPSLGVRQSLRSVSLTLWCPEAGRYVGFAELSRGDGARG